MAANLRAGIEQIKNRQSNPRISHHTSSGSRRVRQLLIGWSRRRSRAPCRRTACGRPAGPRNARRSADSAPSTPAAQVARPSATASSMKVCMNMPRSDHCGGPSLRSRQKNRPTGASKKRGVAGELAEPRRAVLARDLDRGVEVLAADEAAGAERLPEARRIDVVLRLFHRRGRDQRLELGQRRAGQRIDPPGLQVAAGGRPGGRLQQLARPISPGTGSGLNARVDMRLRDRFGDVHRLLSSRGLTPTPARTHR